MRHVADQVADIVKPLCAENRDLSAGGPGESRESAEQRSLAGTVVAQDAVELSAGEIGTHATQSGEAAELLDQVGDGDDGRGFSHRIKANLPSRWNWSFGSESCSCQAAQWVWLPAGRVAVRISMRISPAVVLHGRRRLARSCHRPGLASRL